MSSPIMKVLLVPSLIWVSRSGRRKEKVHPREDAVALGMAVEGAVGAGVAPIGRDVGADAEQVVSPVGAAHAPSAVISVWCCLLRALYHVGSIVWRGRAMKVRCPFFGARGSMMARFAGEASLQGKPVCKKKPGGLQTCGGRT
jgi:hypothetical protein